MTAAAQSELKAIRTAHALALAVEDKDHYTRNHSERVALYATAVGVHIGLPIEYIERIAIAGTLHDVGKLAIPDSVLLKPGPLTTEETALVQRHSEAGERVVLSLGLEEIATWIRHHHERWDGKGYPDGLAGERIPLPSRILGAADALDAMTTPRAYDEALSLKQATRELIDHAEGQFDPQVAACLIELLGDGSLSLSEERRVVTSYAIGSACGYVDADYQRIRNALFPAGERRQDRPPRISVASSV
jgi:HD-GYP domain-containing protein (c-di-GMP phosphodiesterase class II)